MKRVHSFLCQSVPSLLGRSSAEFLHRSERIHPADFEGFRACGATCYMLHHYLELQGIETKLMHKVIGKEDHCYLLHNNNTVIDPTYRQFIPPVRWFDDFIYVGPLKDIEHHCIVSFWSRAKESTAKLDAGNVLLDKHYAAKKGSHFLELHHRMNHLVF